MKAAPAQAASRLVTVDIQQLSAAPDLAGASRFDHFTLGNISNSGHAPETSNARASFSASFRAICAFLIAPDVSSSVEDHSDLPASAIRQLAIQCRNS